MAAAIRRRVRQELGMTVARVVLLLPRFRYRAEMNGIAENELCPVYAGFSDDVPAPDRAEVAEAMWVDWAGFTRRVRAGQFEVSPWCASQVAELAAFDGAEPAHWPAASSADLPSAARNIGHCQLFLSRL
jgi:isopentenyl-diphosphate Delta-isomerase